ncbi:MAG: patatin-like phospholipase family protein, partial [Alphaproteobacteria bacterium]
MVTKHGKNNPSQAAQETPGTAEASTSTSTKKRKRVALALQGGGAHGAFTWGVLDALLEDGRLEIDGISGTSAGGMNAVAFIQGYMKGKEEGARAELRKFWKTISDNGATSPFKPSLY